MWSGWLILIDILGCTWWHDSTESSERIIMFKWHGSFPITSGWHRLYSRTVNYQYPSSSVAASEPNQQKAQFDSHIQVLHHTTPAIDPRPSKISYMGSCSPMAYNSSFHIHLLHDKDRWPWAGRSQGVPPRDVSVKILHYTIRFNDFDVFPVYWNHQHLKGLRWWWEQRQSW